MVNLFELRLSAGNFQDIWLSRHLTQFIVIAEFSLAFHFYLKLLGNPLLQFHFHHCAAGIQIIGTVCHFFQFYIHCHCIYFGQLTEICRRLEIIVGKGLDKTPFSLYRNIYGISAFNLVHLVGRSDDIFI